MTHRSDEKDAGSLRRLAEVLQPYAARLVVVLATLIGLALVNMAVPAFIALLFNEVFPHRDWVLLTAILFGIIAVYASRNVLYYVSKYSAVLIGEQVAFSLRKRLFERLQTRNLQYFRHTNPGEVSSRVMDDSFAVQSFIQDDLPTTLQAACMFAALTVVLYFVNWQLALASTIILPLHLLTVRWFKRPIKHASRQAQEQLAVVHGNLIEKFLGVEVVKGFTAEDRESEAFVRAIDSSRKSQLTSKRFHVTQKIVADLLVGVGTIALLGFGGYQVMKGGEGAMRPGTFIAFFGYVGMLYPTVLDLMSGFAKLTKVSASLDRVYELLDAPPRQREGQGGRPIIRPIEGRLTFREVSFRYEDGPPLLTGVNLDIPAGKVCAIVGRSGCGKSTLVNLVPRFLDPDLGGVAIDDIDVRDFDLKRLRASIGIAFQECFLFNTSVYENLRYARPDATMSQIVSVARRTGAHQFIAKLPEGYATVIGEKGVSLSRGEKQRITLTRAMLKNPRILILDEATASIDTATENQIVPAILDFMKGKTTLMITHRPEMLRHADMVAQLDGGRIVYQGPPAGLPVDALGASHSPTDAVAGDGAPVSSPPARAVHGSVLRSLALAAMVSVGVASARAQQTAPVAPEAPPSSAAPAAAEEPAQPAEPQPPVQTVPLPPAEPKYLNGGYVPMPGMNRLELDELLEVVQAHAQLELNYQPAAAEDAALMPGTPTRLSRVLTFARHGEEVRHLLQVGYQLYRSQPSHVWFHGRSFGRQGVTTNADLPAIGTIIEQALASRAAQTQSLNAHDLAVGTIDLSYVEADRCLAILKTLGYSTVEYKKGEPGVGKAQIIDPSKPLDLTQLPIVTAMPDSDSTDLVGGSKVSAGAFGLVMTPSVATELTQPTSSAPLMKLMVMYHPAKPEQLSRLIDRIRTTIDVPARQILIEAMVLEISESGLKDLGVEWEFRSASGNIETLRLGKLPGMLRAEDSTLDISVNDIFGEFRIKLRALIQDGQANILSRPSVLTLDNRQASIRVGDEIPVAKSIAGLQTGDKISFDFSYIPIGILLNVRPRVAQDSREISMQIDGIVSSTVPGEDLEIIDQATNQVLASAPKISTRRVQTYSRVANNTPFIIGGLVKRDDTSIKEKAPLLGDLPLVGGLFRNESTAKLRSEVIIVITPFVLPEGEKVGRNLPKDEDAFDSFGNQLFRDAYRIRNEDVYDLNFLLQNPYLNRMRELADQAVRADFRLADQPPFNLFAGDRIPGEEILVYRQMYEVIKRLQIDQAMTDDRIIFFHPDQRWEAGFAVTFLQRYLTELAAIKIQQPITDPAMVYEALKGKALAMIYTEQGDVEPRNALAQPVPELRLIDCPNDMVWADKLWELNQVGPDGKQRFAILLRDARDMTRLKRAILLKRTVELNADRQSLSLSNFSVGRLLLMPSPEDEKVHLVDSDTAKYFFLTEHYYPALGHKLTTELHRLRETLQRPAIRRLLEDESLPEHEAITLPKPDNGP